MPIARSEALFAAASFAAVLPLAACGSDVPLPPGTPPELAVTFQATTPSGPGRMALSLEDRRLALAANLLPASARSVLSERRMEHGDYIWNDAGVPPGKLTIWVDLTRQTMSVFRAGHEIGTAVILYGAPTHASPLGSFTVLRKDADYVSQTYDAPMPHSLFLTDDGVALHGATVRRRHATHGCIGLPDAFAKRLFDFANIGDEVVIVQSKTLVQA